MNTVFLYLVESTICVSVLYAIYWFFLKHDTFFKVNRFYLLSSVIFSVLFPLLPISWTFSNPSDPIAVILEPVMITPGRMVHALETRIQWIEIAAIIYFTGVLFFLFRFGLKLIQLLTLARRSGTGEHQGQQVVFINRGYAPFSFLNLVFISKADIRSESMATILEHEHVHIRQLHSIDLILIELTTTVMWFNPVLWLAGREMKTIHEFLADEGVLQNGISRSLYQQMILNETMGVEVNGLTNNFNVSLLKKRIAMMTKSKSGKWAKSKVLIALPVVLALGFVLTARSYSNFAEMNFATMMVSPANLTPSPGIITQDKTKQGTQTKYTAPVKTDQKVYEVATKMPSYTGGDEAMVKFLIGNIKYPEAAIKKNVTGKVFVTFIVRADGTVTDVKILRGIGSGCDEEAARVVKLMPKWIPGEEKGKPVNVSFTLPISFALDADKKEEPKK